MTQVVQEWIDRADEDWQVAHLLIQSGLASYGSICFHAQQCVEKLMKALLIKENIVPPYSHDLLLLDRILKESNSNWQVSLEDLATLTQYGVAARYPGLELDRSDALDCLEKCDRLRAIALQLVQ